MTTDAGSPGDRAGKVLSSALALALGRRRRRRRPRRPRRTPMNATNARVSERLDFASGVRRPVRLRLPDGAKARGGRERGGGRRAGGLRRRPQELGALRGAIVDPDLALRHRPERGLPAPARARATDRDRAGRGLGGRCGARRVGSLGPRPGGALGGRARARRAPRVDGRGEAQKPFVLVGSKRCRCRR